MWSLALYFQFKEESCPTAELSNIGRPNGPASNGPAYLTGELLNTPRLVAVIASHKFHRNPFSICVSEGNANVGMGQRDIH